MRFNPLIKVVFLTVFVSGWLVPATGEPPKSDEYIVRVEALNMRAEPELAGEVITILSEGDELMDLGEPPEYVDETWWRHVRFGEEEGWIADWYALPRPYYDAFREADELGKAGKILEMLDAIKTGARKIGAGGGRWGENYLISPDGKKIVVWGYAQMDEPDLWGGKYPGEGRNLSHFPVLLFASGQGLVDYFRSGESISGKWSPDSHYFAYTAFVLTEYNLSASLWILDSSAGERVDIGGTPSSRFTEYQYEYEFAGDYLVWLDEERVEEPGPPPLERHSFKPVLYAYELASGRKSEVLKADLNTLGGEDTWADSYVGIMYYPVKMVSEGSCATEVKQSDLYKKYNGKDGYAVSWEHFME